MLRAVQQTSSARVTFGAHLHSLYFMHDPVDHRFSHCHKNELFPVLFIVISKINTAVLLSFKFDFALCAAKV